MRAREPNKKRGAGERPDGIGGRTVYKKQVMGQLFTGIGANEPSIQGLNVSHYYDYYDRPPRSPRLGSFFSP